MLAVLVMALVYNWNDFFNPLIYLNSSEKFHDSSGLQFFKGSQEMYSWTDDGNALVSLTPVLFVQPVKYFIQNCIKSIRLEG